MNGRVVHKGETVRDDGLVTIRTATSTATAPETVVAELKAGLDMPSLSLVVVFVSHRYDVRALAPLLEAAFAPALVVGCTTAGELTPDGYGEGTVSAVSFAAPDFYAVAHPIKSLSHFRVDQGIELVQTALGQLREGAPDIGRDSIFAFLMIDGLSLAEETVVSALYTAMDEIPLFGGSAGDGLCFGRTWLILGGEVLQDSAVVVFVGSRAPFTVFKTEHFQAGGPKMVVTDASPATRVVREINAEPAMAEYARLVGLDSANLDPMAFASHPVVVTVGGQPYVRSIQKVEADGSLTFFCAIDEGIVLTAARGMDILENLEQAIERVHAAIGPPQLILACDCIFRRLEVRAKGLEEALARVFRTHTVVGFNTYGEQYQAMHVNQTFTGVAIGRSRGEGS